MRSFALWFWNLPSRIAGMRDGAVIRFMVFCMALAIVLPFSETYLAIWAKGSGFSRASMALAYDKFGSFLALLGAGHHPDIRPFLRNLSRNEFVFANSWAWLTLASMIIPLALIVGLLIVHYTWNSVSTWVDVLSPLTKARKNGQS